LTGKQKAALLLTSLDAATAAELLKGVDAATVQELAVELSYLDAAGARDAGQTAEVARAFCKSLRQQAGFHFKSFLRDMLRNSVGEEQAKRIQQEIQNLLQRRDPFLSIRSADPQTLAAVLETEHPQAVAVVLSELPPKKGSEILGLLGESVRFNAISRMTSISSTTPEAKLRIAQTVQGRMETVGSGQPGGGALQVRPEQSLRKVAVIMRNLDKDIRDGVLEAIRQKDEEAGDKIANLIASPWTSWLVLAFPILTLHLFVSPRPLHQRSNPHSVFEIRGPSPTAHPPATSGFSSYTHRFLLLPILHLLQLSPFELPIGSLRKRIDKLNLLWILVHAYLCLHKLLQLAL